jgi:signal transduction histidine kinase
MWPIRKQIAWSRSRAMRGARILVFVVSAVANAVTITVALLPQPSFAYHQSVLRAAFATSVPLIALVADFLVIGRFIRRPSVTELALACSVTALAMSELAFVAIPMLSDHVRPDSATWAALGGSALGGVLFVLASLVPHRKLRRPGLALAASGVALTTTLLLIGILAASFAARLPEIPIGATVRSLLADPYPHGDAVLSAPEVLLAVSYGVAAAGFLRRFEQARNEFFGWLAVAAVLAAASYLNYFLYPDSYSQSVSIGDIFRFCFYATLLAGTARETWSYSHTLSEAAVLEERQRIARDLHDGLAQELAYLLRNINSLDGTVDKETTAALRRAAERAQLEVRVAISTLASSHSQSVNAAIAQAVSAVAARDHIKLELDIVPGIRLPATRAEALVRIACEAVGNAARHSGAEQVSLSLRRQGSRVRLRVSDNGSGFDPAVPAYGFGLTSMHDRASLVGGDLRISSEPGHGTEVVATL